MIPVDPPNQSRASRHTSPQYSPPPLPSPKHDETLAPSLTNRNIKPLSKEFQQIKELSERILDKYNEIKILFYIENDMQELLSDFNKTDSEYVNLKTSFRSLRKSIEKIQEQVEILENNLLEFINKLIDQEKSIKNLPICFSKISQSNIAFNPKLICQILIQKTWNIVDYLKDVIATTNAKKELLFNFFDLSAIDDVVPVVLQLEILGEETHNGGTTPVLICFIQSGYIIKKIVYKPRSAETECAIIELFKKLNKIPNFPQLPEYKILSLENCSFWEFIDEKTLTVDANIHLTTLGLAKDELKEAQDNLNYLDTICKRIGVTDLHMENIFFVRNSLQMVPIDRACCITL
jgi:lantibiotic modifying enzyme